MLELKAMWRPGWEGIGRGTDAQKVANEIYSISESPTTDEIVEMASNPETESYKLFDWDDSVAGPKWRKEQARLICRTLIVNYVQPSEDEDKKVYIPVKLFHGNPVKNEGFVAITTIVQNHDMYQQLLERAKAELVAFKKRYAILKELEAIFDLIERI